MIARPVAMLAMRAEGRKAKKVKGEMKTEIGCLIFRDVASEGRL